MLFALVCGFCLPVCDCATIPMFKSLIKKGVPTSSAVVFMVATPVINPVVILSTYYAFNGNWKIVLARILLGTICAIGIGLIFTLKPMQVSFSIKSYEYNCECGCLFLRQKPGWKGKISLFWQHAQNEFFNVGKFLLIGIFISTVFQVISSKIACTDANLHIIPSILLLMGMAFLLSLCSSSDAIVARSFANQFPFISILGFLVFGPMIDIKNLTMLSGNFPKKFIAKLTITVFFVCFLVMCICSFIGLEVYRMRKLNIFQYLIETVLYILFATALLALIISDRYLSYVTPRMKPYLYFAVVVLFLFGIFSFRLFQFAYKPKLTHCLVILIPLVIVLIPKNGIDLHSLTSGYINGSDLNGKTILPLLLPLHTLSTHHKIKKIMKNRLPLPLLMDI